MTVCCLLSAVCCLQGAHAQPDHRLHSIANDCGRVSGCGGAKAPAVHGVCKARDGVSEGRHKFFFGLSHRSASKANLHPALDCLWGCPRWQIRSNSPWPAQHLVLGSLMDRRARWTPEPVSAVSFSSASPPPLHASLLPLLRISKPLRPRRKFVPLRVVRSLLPLHSFSGRSFRIAFSIRFPPLLPVVRRLRENREDEGRLSDRCGGPAGLRHG